MARCERIVRLVELIGFGSEGAGVTVVRAVHGPALQPLNNGIGGYPRVL